MSHLGFNSSLGLGFSIGDETVAGVPGTIKSPAMVVGRKEEQSVGAEFYTGAEEGVTTLNMEERRSTYKGRREM